MLTIQLTDGQPRLVLGCDKCGHAIEHHDEAVVIYKNHEPDEAPDRTASVLHHDCQHELLHENWPAIPLDVALVQLASDLGVTADEAAETALRHQLIEG